MQMLDKLKLNSSMTVKEVDDIRSRFATSITSATTYRAQIALAFVEGDAVKKIQC